MSYGDSNTFAGLRTVNVRRCEKWFHFVDVWSPTDWMTAVAGEVGEAANKIKKLRRIQTEGLESPANRALVEAAGSAEKVVPMLHEQIGDELADAVIYIDLLAARLGIDLGEAVIRKFNATSVKVGSPERLPY